MATNTLSLSSSIFFSILVISINFPVVEPALIGCILDFSNFDYWNGASCKGGNWDEFLNSNCCGSSFIRYLYQLGERANQTGQIYLNYTEQRNCLTSMKSFNKDVMGCGIEKLTGGSGGCSDFAVVDVVNHFEEELRSLEKDCNHLDSEGEWDQKCGACTRSWEEMRGTLSKSRKAMSDEIDLCRFAVLVSLTSNRIQDEKWITSVYRCLGQPYQYIDAPQHYSTENSNTSTDQYENNSTKKTKISKGLWFLIGGAIGILAIVVTAAWILLRRRMKSYVQKGKEASVDMQSEVPNCQKVPIKEVYSATNNLDMMNFIGEGTAGKVYKGIMSNGTQVAIKHIVNDGHVETFVREVTSLSHVRHPNLVALLGYCTKEDECFLVYELCPNGDLSKWLFGKDNVLSWIQRLEIAIDSARSLWFLHTYPEGSIVHRDIKPTNILLGTNFEAKLSDFGLSKVIDLGQSFQSSEVRGTFGYLDPEYQQDHHVNSSSDVYSFGMVLLQVISGQKVVNMNLKKPMSLDKMAKFLTRSGTITEFADPKLNGEYSVEAFELTLKLALSCTGVKQERPSMEKVVTILEKALYISTRAKASTPYGTPTPN